MSEERFREILDEVLEEKLDAKLEEKLGKVNARLDKLEARTDKLETRMDNLEVRMDNLEARMECVENEVRRLGLILENDVIHPLRLLCENLYPASKGWLENEHRLSTLEEDVMVIKTVVKQHSEDIHILQQA